MSNVMHCPNCGAPVTSEVCQYCGAKTGLDTASADMMYDSIDVKEAHLNFWNVIFPLIFAVAFGFFGFVFPIIFSDASEGEFIKVMLMCSIFAIIGVVAAFIVLRNIFFYVMVSSFGEEIIGTVYGYMNDNVMYNEKPGQKVKILVSTRSGNKFLLYQLNSPDKPYAINSRVKLRVYKDYCRLYRSDRRNVLD